MRLEQYNYTFTYYDNQKDFEKAKSNAEVASHQMTVTTTDITSAWQLFDRSMKQQRRTYFVSNVGIDTIKKED